MTLQPVVLLKVARDGSVDAMTSAGVIVVVVNEKSETNAAVILQQRDQEKEIMDLIGSLPLIGEGTALAEIAKAELRRRKVSK